MERKALTEVRIAGYKPLKTGKIREIFDLDDRLLIVATDRISTFDVILPDGVPGKGEVLTKLSAFWFRKLAAVAPNHFLSLDPGDLPEPLRGEEDLNGRFMIVRKAAPLPFECIVRGYLLGNGWSEYCRTGEVSGVKLKPGLQEGAELPEPIFTPTTKAPIGVHDEFVTFETVASDLGRERASWVRDRSISLYRQAQSHAKAKGIIIADTKFEFGVSGSEALLIDECLTPDSSRFWPADSYRPGKPGVSLDKQYVRDFLIRSGWNKQPPAPRLPAEVVQETARRYRDILDRLTSA